MADLLKSNTVELWNRSLAVYTDVIKAVDEDRVKKRKGSKKDQEPLQDLDKWFQEDLPAIVTSRSPPHLTHEELSKLMKWKLTKGKFRPRLTEMVKENPPSKVEELTRKAYSELPNTKNAIEALKQLKAVGPATASAILCVFKPQYAPFMSDEATIAVPGITRLDYTLGQYLTFADAMVKKAKELNKLQGGDSRKWTAHDVELALWSYTVGNRLVPHLFDEEAPSTNRQGIDAGDSGLPPPLKKRKK